MPSMTERDFLAVAKIQHRFYRAGWRWQESTYKDSREDEVYLQFSPSTNCHAFQIGNSSTSEERQYGWGRFQRLDAWLRAEAFLLEEQGKPNEIRCLREYKSKYGVE